MLTPEQFAELKRLCEIVAPTLGEAITIEVVGDDFGWSANENSFKFWHEARSALPNMIAELEALREVAAAAEKYADFAKPIFGASGFGNTVPRQHWLKISEAIVKWRSLGGSMRILQGSFANVVEFDFDSDAGFGDYGIGHDSYGYGTGDGSGHGYIKEFFYSDGDCAISDNGFKAD